MHRRSGGHRPSSAATGRHFTRPSWQRSGASCRLLQSACDNAHGAIGSLAYRALLYFGDARGAAALCAQLDALVAAVRYHRLQQIIGENGVSRAAVDDTPG